MLSELDRGTARGGREQWSESSWSSQGGQMGEEEKKEEE